ncbi:uncharacterized protein LOC131602767 [Vicia villosa]|uniref:uncharacterized protein LOC131602767 n=1 Tax=Vicia villosa TaxID=3911 RepID=UPI00273C9EA2|nr:uncharacterized protein LOC131602767 [Vicia villosa]
MAARKNIFSYLQEDLLECIFKSLNDDHYTFKSLTLVSKHFLSITNRFRFFATITVETIPNLPRLFHRFPNLTSLNLSILSISVEQVDQLLALISTFPLHIRSLNLSNGFYSVPANGLIALSKTMKNLRSLSFYRLVNYRKKVLFLIADCFPLLEELNFSYPRVSCSADFDVDVNDPLLALPNLRNINLSCNFITDQFINFLRHSCKHLQVIRIIYKISKHLGDVGKKYGKYDSSDIIYL